MFLGIVAVVIFFKKKIVICHWNLLCLVWIHPLWFCFVRGYIIKQIFYFTFCLITKLFIIGKTKRYEILAYYCILWEIFVVQLVRIRCIFLMFLMTAVVIQRKWLRVKPRVIWAIIVNVIILLLCDVWTKIIKKLAYFTQWKSNNSFTTEVRIISKPVHWFAEQMIDTSVMKELFFLYFQ